MKNEAEFNTIILNSIVDQGGWAFKIPDPRGQYATSSTPRCFDGFGTLPSGTPLYWEAKHSKSFSSLNLQTIQDHQIDNLSSIKRLNPQATCIILYGLKEGRGKYRVYVFCDMEEIARRRERRDNYKKKELLKLPYLIITKKLIPGLVDYVAYR